MKGRGRDEGGRRKEKGGGTSEKEGDEEKENIREEPLDHDVQVCGEEWLCEHDVQMRGRRG